jgi:hypothetical protein
MRALPNGGAYAWERPAPDPAGYNFRDMRSDALCGEGGFSPPDHDRRFNAASYPSACFTRWGVIGVSRSRTPASSATALAIAGATSGVAIWPTPVG